MAKIGSFCCDVMSSLRTICDATIKTQRRNNCIIVFRYHYHYNLLIQYTRKKAKHQVKRRHSSKMVLKSSCSCSSTCTDQTQRRICNLQIMSMKHFFLMRSKLKEDFIVLCSSTKRRSLHQPY